MSRIPEVISLDAQAEKLALTFGGNTDFEDVRGKCGDTFLATTDAAMLTKEGNAQAPSAGVRDLKKFFISFANVRNKIAQLERDGYTLAAHEAREALKYPDYRMLGEISPICGTTPVTLVMLNPELTLWLLEHYQFGGYRKKDLDAWNTPEAIRDALFYEFYQHSYEWAAIASSTVCASLAVRGDELLKRILGQRSSERAASKPTITYLKMSVRLPDAPKNKNLAFDSSYFAIACPASKHNILRCFTKQEQRRIALWEFHLPRTYAQWEEKELHFGLHQQGEHEYWMRKYAPLCSLNRTHGYGAIAYPGEAYSCFDEKAKRSKRKRILLTHPHM